MTRELIISCIIHLMALALMMRMPKTPPLQIGRVGERIEVRMTSAKAGTPSEARKGSGIENQKKAESKKTEKKEEKKKIEKKIEKKPVEKQKKKAEKIEEKPKEENVEVVAVKQPEGTSKEIDKDLTGDRSSVEEDVEVAKNSTGEKDQTAGNPEGNELDEGIVRLSDGSLSVKHQGVKGLSYGFISNPEPAYPSVAKRLGFSGDIVIKVIMQFSSSGDLEDLRFVGEKDKFGFTNEVEKTIRNWKLTPIKYKGQFVKMRFYKTFKFQEQG